MWSMRSFSFGVDPGPSTPKDWTSGSEGIQRRIRIARKQACHACVHSQNPCGTGMKSYMHLPQIDGPN